MSQVEPAAFCRPEEYFAWEHTRREVNQLHPGSIYIGMFLLKEVAQGVSNTVKFPCRVNDVTEREEDGVLLDVVRFAFVEESRARRKKPIEVSYSLVDRKFDKIVPPIRWLWVTLGGVEIDTGYFRGVHSKSSDPFGGLEQEWGPGLEPPEPSHVPVVPSEVLVGAGQVN